MQIDPLSAHDFGARISGIALSQLDEQGFKAIYGAFLKYGFIVFPDQALTEAEQITFGERFGVLEFGALPLANQIKLDDGGYSEIFPVASQRMQTNLGNEAWHTDSTYWPVSSKCALLTAVKVPGEGGQTELADLRAGFSCLADDVKARIRDLSAYHSTQYSQAHDLGHYPDPRPGSLYHGEAYLRPLVKVHPETGVPNLFIGRHAFGIPGLSRDESRALLQDLVDFVVSDPARVYQHQWRVGDTLLWDNRALLHRARPYDYAQPRVLIGTRVAGDVPSELAYYPSDPEAEAGRGALERELAVLRFSAERAQGKGAGLA